jgi:hypothetical protein
MIQFQIQWTKWPTRSAAGRQGRINKAACVALVAHLLSACSIPLQSGSETSAVALYPDLNDPPPKVAVSLDQVAQIKGELVRVRDDQERAAAQQ